MSLPNPYALLGSLLLTAALLGGVWLHGRAAGKARQVEADAALIARKDAALRSAAAALGDAATRFREIDAVTDIAKAEAAALRRASDAFAEQAGQDKADMQRRIAELNAQRERERRSCAIAEVPVCGSPLL